MLLLSPHDRELFFKLFHALLCFVNERRQVIPGIETPAHITSLAAGPMRELRDVLQCDLSLIDAFVDANPFQFDDEELAIVASWRQVFIFRHLKNYSVFLAAEDPPIAYGVTELTHPFEDLLGSYVPVWTETVLLPFQGKIVYDGVLSSFNISFGPGYRDTLNEEYKAAKQRLGIVTSLPIVASPVPAKKGTKKKPKTKGK